MNYARLLSLTVDHAGYAGGLCSDAVLEATPACARNLARQRMLLRLQPWGLSVHLPVGADGLPLLPWDAHATLDFVLRARSTDLLQRTEFGASPVTYGLPAEPVAGPKPQDLVPLPMLVAQAGVGDTLARVHLAGLRPAWLAAPPVLRLLLTPRRLPWVYYAIARRADAPEPAIPDQPATRAGQALRFKVQPLTAATSAGDAVGRMLLARHAGARCWRLVSGRPVAVGGVGVPPLALQVGTETVVNPLPPPPGHQLATGVLGASRRGPPQPFVYGVVHC